MGTGGAGKERTRNHRGDEEDRAYFANRKRIHRESVFPMQRLIRSYRDSSNRWSTKGRIHFSIKEGIVYRGLAVWLCAI